MALLKALNDSCRKDVEQQLLTCQLRRAEVAENKALLKQKAKAELTRPGTLAAAFTLGVLAAPGGKKNSKRHGGTERTERSEQRAAAAAERAEQSSRDAAAHAKPTGKKTDKDKSFDPLDIIISVISSVVVRVAANWVTGLTAAPPQPAQQPMQEADVDTSTQVDL